MEAGLSTAVVGGTKVKGSLAALSSSIVGLGSTAKAFVLTHPTTIGFVLGAGTIYSINRIMTKRRKKKLSMAKAV